MAEKALLTEVKQVMTSALTRTRAYFESEFSISSDEFPPEEGDADSLTLLDMTAIIGLGGTINLFIAFSFEEKLIRTLYERMTEGMKIAPDEVTMLKEATAGEIINIVIGHCTADLQALDKQGVSITPPTVLGRVKTLQRFEDALFHTRSLITPFGRMDVNLIGPRDLFDTTLERQQP